MLACKFIFGYRSRMTETEKLLARIDAYCNKRGISESTFGLYAMKDARVVGRLRKGLCADVTKARLMAYITGMQNA